MENTLGVLLLSHVGFSFMEDLIGTVTARGVKTCVLSSLPEPRHQVSRPEQLIELADELHVTSEHVLTPEDVDAYIDQLEATGTSVQCCLTVWEGYRHLMASANARLGVPDLDEKQILKLRDKLTLRNRLADVGLTRGRASALTPTTLAERQREGGRYFVKPVSGIASFGTFPLTPETTWSELERLTLEARSDTVYANTFATTAGPFSQSGTDLNNGADSAVSAPSGVGCEVEFLIEDYVPGQEFSFEVVVVDGDPYVVAVHEKCEVTESTGTVLENACVSPPTTLSQEEVAAGIRWTTRALTALDLRWGCFHVEARYASSGWDLIEVNPRVGGSLISPSVAALTGGPGMLDLWLDLLLTASQPGGFLKTLKGLSFGMDGTTPSPNATFFRVFFTGPGTIREVGLNDDLPFQPLLSHVLLKPGDVVEASSREVFLGQVLWRMDLADRDDLLAELLPASMRAIEIMYETESG
ncbi:Biotin carboxylase [Actinopolyspora alba]|uniref:Biotin carboxylase n=1 Tax=Actinopolyspora alba TaxID=673379 RepID=A0A1I1YYV8_9ACTN|nr:ATP-grasp domain-containing protein [Actinopolyspora alba]SFE23353.1 Biotin carboxylase [Actinopolyspora alba]